MKINLLPIFMIVIMCGLIHSSIQAQELDASVSVNTLSLQAMQSDPKVFKTLETSIKEFLNSQTWTDENYDDSERIKCSFQITITSDPGKNVYGASIVVQATRPVYGTEYETPVFTFNDNNFNFAYEEFQPIQQTRNTYFDNLSSVLSYYANVIIGLDFDTFELKGGDRYLLNAQMIRNAAPVNNASSFPGWASSDRSKINRYNLIEELMSSKYTAYRESMYLYHRKGLDVMNEELEIGRDNIEEAISNLSFAARRTTFTPIFVEVFLNSKASEIISIYEPAPVIQRRKIYDLIVGMNPTAADKFKVLR